MLDKRNSFLRAYQYYRAKGFNATAALDGARKAMAAAETAERGKAPRAIYGASGTGSGVWQRREDMPRFSSASDRAYYIDNFPAGWRDLGDAHEVCRMRSHGWYTDDMQNETAIGRVLQIPARNGVPQYVPGMRETGADGVTIWPLDRYDDKEECARAADGYAERFAEAQREYNEAWQAGSRAASMAEEIGKLRTDAMDSIASLRGMRRTVRREVEGILEEIAELRRKIHELESNYGRTEAFNEGKG